MQSINHFQIQFKEVKMTEGGTLKIKGYASTPDLDRYDDIVKPEAFASAMKTYMQNPVVLLGHDNDKPIGLVTEYNLDPNGLEVTCEITNNTDECMEKIQNKTLRGFSIGWRCLDCIYKEEGTKYIREILSLDLAEISVVAVPANPSTLFTLAKSLKKFFDTKDAEETVETPVETPEVIEEVETPAEEVKSEPEAVETPETPIEETINNPETIEAETPEAETPQTEEIPVAIEEEKGEDVQPVENADPVAEGATEEEVKALIDQIVAQSVDTATASLIEEIKTLKDALVSLEKKHTELETDVLKIEVKPSQPRTESKALTYGLLFK